MRDLVSMGVLIIINRLFTQESTLIHEGFRLGRHGLNVSTGQNAVPFPCRKTEGTMLEGMPPHPLQHRPFLQDLPVQGKIKDVALQRPLETIPPLAQPGRARIDGELRRLDEDEFGYCATCGDPIDTRRLEITPTATLCVACAEREED